MKTQGKPLSEATFVPPFDPPVDVGKLALAVIIAVGIIGLTLSSKGSRSSSHAIKYVSRPREICPQIKTKPF